MEPLFEFLIAITALSIPTSAVVLSFRQKTQKNKIRQLELQKELAELEIKKQDNMLKLLEEENRKLENEINRM